MTALLLIKALLYWFMALLLASFAHELGHVLATLLVKNKLDSVTFGAGPWRLYLRRQSPQICIAAPIPLGGLCQSSCQEGTGFWGCCRRRYMIELAGGSAFNLLLATVLLSSFGSWMQILGAAQLLVGLSQLLPLQDYDGARLWRLLRR